jgi:hypothetical protein
MPTISAADTNGLLDRIGSGFLRAVGDQTAAYGLGTSGAAWGFIGAMSSTKTYLQGMAATYLEPVAAIDAKLLSLLSTFSAETLAAGYVTDLLTGLQGHVAKSGLVGVSSLDTFLTYYNIGAGGPWLALQSDLSRAMYQKWSGNPLGLSATNFYQRIVQGATYTNALAKGILASGVVTFTAGVTIDSAAFAGGFPWLVWSGAAGGGVVTVTANVRHPDGTTSSGKTFTGTLAGAAGSVALAPGGGSPAPANSLILQVTAIAAVVGITAGTAYVEARPPAGRTVLPL